MIQVHQAKLSEKKKRYHCDISSFPNTALHADSQPHVFRLFLCFPNTATTVLQVPWLWWQTSDPVSQFLHVPSVCSSSCVGHLPSPFLALVPPLIPSLSPDLLPLFMFVWKITQSLLLLPLGLTGALQIKRTVASSNGTVTHGCQLC